MTAVVLVPPAPAPPSRDLNMLQLVRAMQRNMLGVFSQRCYRELNLSGGTLFGPRWHLLSDPAAVRRVLAENTADYVKPPAMVRLTRPFAGYGVLLSEGDAWRRQRRRLAPVFTPGALDQVLPRAAAAAAESLVRSLKDRPAANLAAALDQAALDAVMRALFSHAETDEDWRQRVRTLIHHYLSGVAKVGRPNLFDILARDPDDFTGLERGRRAYSRRWFREVDAIIERRREAPAGEDAADLLDLLLQARDAHTGEPLPAPEIRDQIATMLAAGYETTARLLFWVVYLLARDPAEQDRVRAELAAEPGPVETLSDLARWPRLRCVLQETLRLYPTAPLISRKALADDPALGVRKGDQVTISPWVMHRHEALWPEPAAFRPERFEGRPNAYLQGGAYIPFSTGPRICIGATFAVAEASVIIGALLSRYVVELEDEAAVEPVASISIRPSREPLFRLSPVAAAA